MRRKNAAGAATTWNYDYDGGGNRTQAKETTEGTVASNWFTTYDGAGFASTATNVVGRETVMYAHDAVGDLTAVNSSNEPLCSRRWVGHRGSMGRLSLEPCSQLLLALSLALSR